MTWLVIAIKKDTGSTHPYGPFATRQEAYEWAQGKFDDRYRLEYQWMRRAGS
jgi:hypothetical protein